MTIHTAKVPCLNLEMTIDKFIFLKKHVYM